MSASLCLAVALQIAADKRIELDSQARAHLALGCQAMAVTHVRATREDHAGRLAACTALSSVRYRLPHDALPAILTIEAGWLGAQIANKDQSIDRGPYQINSQWDRSWKIIFGFPTRQIAAAAVTYDPCINSEAAAILLARCMRDRQSFYAALGCYASPNPARANRYAEILIESAKKIEKMRK